MKKKPMIGVMPLWDEEKNSLWVLPGYLDGIRMAGGIPVIFPLTTQKDELTELQLMQRLFVYRRPGCKPGALSGAKSGGIVKVL